MAPSIDSVFIIRHGERLDHVMKMWRPDPAHGLWDPPLSPEGHEQAEKTGRHLVKLLKEQGVDLETTTVVIYTSPFQRCIDTSLGIAQHVPNTVLRLELGLGEWMCERFFEDDIAPAARLIARQQEALARRQAHAFSVARSTGTKPTLPLVDYGYRPLRMEFEFPERYGDMLKRFDEARLHCLATATLQLPKPAQHQMIMIFVTHAVGVNALLDGFRNQLTRPIETGYCSISRVTRMKTLALPTTPPPPLPSPKEEKDPNELYSNEWTIDLLASDTHIH
ncbi:histidine phosphatase superfamily [Fennellomyces sp. T-0311]|nr:histidine phosphatase superfamily [Fennellomyces sp. T-0311]